MNFDTKDDNDRNKLVGVEEQSDWAKKNSVTRNRMNLSSKENLVFLATDQNFGKNFASRKKFADRKNEEISRSCESLRFFADVANIGISHQ